MNDSLEAFSWNPLGVRERLLFTALPKSFVAGPATYNRILEIFAWSLSQLCIGQFPHCRHDDAPFQSKPDAWRQGQVGAALPQAALLQAGSG